MARLQCMKLSILANTTRIAYEQRRKYSQGKLNRTFFFYYNNSLECAVCVCSVCSMTTTFQISCFFFFQEANEEEETLFQLFQHNFHVTLFFLSSFSFGHFDNFCLFISSYFHSFTQTFINFLFIKIHRPS